MIQDSIYDEIMIRNGVRDRIEGEKISSHLLSKEKEETSRKIITEMLHENGLLLQNSDAVAKRIRDIYDNLYSKVDVYENNESEFLNTISNVINEDENKELTAKVNDKEILEIIKAMNKGKTPGEDGLPVEFYLKTWHIIKQEFMKVIKYVLEIETLAKKKKKKKKWGVGVGGWGVDKTVTERR